MSKLFSRATVTGATLTGASLKSALTAFWDALGTAGLSDVNRATVTATSTLTVAQCGLLLIDATAGNIVLTLPASGAASDDAIFKARRLDGTANTVTIQRAGTDTINGGVSILLPALGNTEIQLPAGAVNWRAFGSAVAGPLATSGITGAAASGANSDITSLAGLTTAITIAQGGVHGDCLLEYVSTTQIRLKPQNGNRLTVNGVSCTVPDTPLTLAATGLQPVFASTNRAITSNVATRTHAALAVALPVGSQILVLDSGGAENYNGLKTVTASTTTTTSYAAVAANEGTTADTGSITPIYHTYAVATAGAISSIEASLTARATSTATGNKGVEIKAGDETRTFVGTFRIAAGPVFANNVQSWFNGRPPKREYFSVLANRAINTSYTNSTLQDMEVLVSGTESLISYALQITVDGAVRANSTHNDVSSGAKVFLNATVPPGSSYQVTSSTPGLWNELRLP